MAIPVVISFFFFGFQSAVSAQFLGGDFSYHIKKGLSKDTIPVPRLDPSVSKPGTNYTAQVKYRVVLKLYYHCMHENFDPIQTVTVHEGIAQIQTATTLLSLDSVSTHRKYLTAGCNGMNEQCLKTATYSGEVELRNLVGGYNITWGYCCWNMSVVNLNNLKPQGLALVLHVPFTEGGSDNSTPSFLDEPVIFACADNFLNINSTAIDPDGDELAYTLVHPNTFLQKEGQGTLHQAEIFPAQEVFKPLVIGRPPFQKVGYNDGYGYSNPLGKSAISINRESGSIDCKPVAAGKYLVGIGVSETRDGKLIGETQRIFIVEIFSAPK